ncbi:Oidioi.mRNA.OKI2018_I69.XSR.g15681.t1.cds [Oikopleura dioica]|uniref:Oidioi.mRNA.OKI2018_I69.XSR.g15681.t1.cds n=1 Tax=Oikopleura dioica TaxID=34765 RepID=A0ABN7SDL9_OIKDI|nr:Oidioi.mRNA.OKI2018_I69.XSR.g15681.t1.cds [Oikopleura dioica]
MEELENGTQCRLSEKKIRDRIGLEKDKQPEDLRTLKLPGSYHDKITHLDNALQNFTRLQNLDLARNALLSLDGLSHLRHLESLNLYYNNVCDLDELYKLKQNKKLENIDLRLNPVTKNEPDYRLFLVHILENLQRLDDRPVRDAERSTASIHFAQNKKWTRFQKAERAEQTVEKETAPVKYTNERVDYIKNNIAKHRAYDDVEDVRLMLDGLNDVLSEDSRTDPSSNSCLDQFRGGSSTLPNRSLSTQNLPSSGTAPIRRSLSKAKEPETRSFGIANIRQAKRGMTAEDENAAQTEYRSLATFTRAPPSEWTSEVKTSPQKIKTIPTSVPRRPRNLSSSTVASVIENTDQDKLKPLLELIDACYAGPNSLQRSPTFIQKLNAFVSEHAQNEDARHQLIDREIELRASASSEQERLRQQLENAEVEIRRLKNEKQSMRDSQRSSSSHSSNINEDLVRMLKESHEMLKKQNQRLEQEIDDMRLRHEKEKIALKENYGRLKSSIRFIHGSMDNLN